MRNRFSLYADAGVPAVVMNGKGRSRFFLVCEHASRQIPSVLGSLGLNRQERSSHIAWDIGSQGVARGLAKLLDAPLVLQRYSRLVYDCNRPPQASTAIPEVSEGTEIPGNHNLREIDRQARTNEIYVPFHERIRHLLDAQLEKGLEPIFVTIHSFTPVYLGVERHLELGVLHDEDARFADKVLAAADESRDLIAKRNEPYGPQDGVTHTLNLHCRERGLANVMLEVRNDLISSKAGQETWTVRLAELLQQAEAAMVENSGRVISKAAGSE